MSRKKILVVDDDETILESVSIVLDVAGYDWVTSNNGRAALAAVEHNKPDLIISDVQMPGMNGYEFYEALRQNSDWVSIPFVFLTGLRDKEDIRKGYKLGVDHYLVKPFTPEDLLVAVENRLQRSEAIDAISKEEIEASRQKLIRLFNHELRTPLFYIQGYLSMLNEGDTLTGNLLQGMRDGAERLHSLIENLAFVFELESGQVEKFVNNSSVELNLGDELGYVLDRFGMMAPKKDIELTRGLPSTIKILGVSLYLQDAFSQILDNAIKFTPRGGTIDVSAITQPNQVTIIIKDSGVGISPDKIEQIFDKFQQIDRDKNEQQGIGLGLAIAQKLIHLHGGSITVESQQGDGTKVLVTFPTLPSTAAAPAPR